MSWAGNHDGNSTAASRRPFVGTRKTPFGSRRPAAANIRNTLSGTMSAEERPSPPPSKALRDPQHDFYQCGCALRWLPTRVNGLNRLILGYINSLRKWPRGLQLKCATAATSQRQPNRL